MLNKSIIDNSAKIIIKTYLKNICSSIDIQNLKLLLNKKRFNKVDQFHLEAKNLIYQSLYINKIIISFQDCNLKFNYKNNILFSEDLFINSFLTLNNINLENILFSSKWKNFRNLIERAFTNGRFLSKVVINNDLIIVYYEKNTLNKKILLSLNLKENLIFLEDINNKNKIFLPLDKNIKFNCLYIKNELININLSSKVVFDS